MKIVIIKNLIIKQATPTIGIQKLIDKINKINTNTAFIQIFRASAIIDREHLIISYLSALNSFKEKQNTSNKIAIEMLLFAGMTKQINAAISKIGAENNANLIIFSNSKQKYLMIKKYLKDETNFLPSLSQIKKTANAYKLILNKAAKANSNQKIKKQVDTELFQRIAISNLKD